MKRCFALIALVAFMLSGCGDQRDGDKTGGELVVYTSVDQHIAEEVLDDFEEETGIEVLPVYDIEASKTTGLANRLIAEKDNPQGDVFWSSEIIMTMKLMEEGVFGSYFPKNGSNIPATYKDENGYWSGFGGRARVMIVNTDIMGGEDYPDSVYDLTDEAYGEYKKAIAYPMFGTTMTHLFVMGEKWGDDKALKYFRDARDNNTVIVDGNSVVRDLVANGEAAFGITDTDDAFAAKRENKPVEVLYLDQDGEGTLVIPNTVGLVKGGPNPEEGKQFIEYLLREETEKKLMDMGFIDVSLNSEESEVEFLDCDFHRAYENGGELLEQVQNELVR